MSEARRPFPPPVPRDDPPSLWREIADGSAGPGVRVGVSIALAPLLAGLAFLGSYVVAGYVPRWARNWNGNYLPSDELVFAMLALAAVGYIPCLSWLWTRGHYRMNEWWKAALLTGAVALLTILVGVFIEESRMSRGGEEVLIGGVVCIAGAAVIMIWVQAARRFARLRPMRHADGALDLRCPACGYRMVGLRECRCPECGTEYTLDDLLARQQFAVRSDPAIARSTVESDGGNGAAAAKDRIAG